MNDASLPGATGLPETATLTDAHKLISEYAACAGQLQASTRSASKDIEVPGQSGLEDAPEDNKASDAAPAEKSGEMRKGASIEPAVSAPSPLFPLLEAPRNEAPAHLTVTLPDRDEVFTPAPKGNPAIQAMKEFGLYQHPGAPGQHVVTCVWASEHAPGQPEEGVYFEPTLNRPVGEFVCTQTHVEEPRMDRFLERLSVKESDARCKPRVRMVPGEMIRIGDRAEQALTSLDRFYQSDGIIVTIRRAGERGTISVPVTEHTIIKALAEACDWERREGATKEWRRCDPPAQVAKQLINSQTYEHLPTLDHIARQPFFREADGVLITTPGYDAVSRTYAAFPGRSFPVVLSSPDAAHEALAELKELLSEFHFAAPVDRSASLCAIITAAIRSSLPIAPAFNITASTPGSGKSYLGGLIAAFAGPGEPLTLSYPTTSEEASKAMLAALMGKPSVIYFDDMQTNWFPHGMMNRMLTNGTVADRLLGSNNTRQVGTKALVLGTGNNVGPVRDMCRRVVTITLRPQTGSPATLHYELKPVEKVKADRERFVSLALRIPSAWRAAGCPRVDVPSVASFGVWADLCRQSLMWLGEPDPATSLIHQVQHDPDAETLGRLMRAWHAHFGSKATTLRKVIERATVDESLKDAVWDLPVTDRVTINHHKFGWFVSKNVHRIVDGMFLQKEPSSERNAWSVQLTDATDAGPPAEIKLPNGTVMIGGEIF